jgi:hypothetical protein
MPESQSTTSLSDTIRLNLENFFLPRHTIKRLATPRSFLNSVLFKTPKGLTDSSVMLLRNGKLNYFQTIWSVLHFNLGLLKEMQSTIPSQLLPL